MKNALPTKNIDDDLESSNGSEDEADAWMYISGALSELGTWNYGMVKRLCMFTYVCDLLHLNTFVPKSQQYTHTHFIPFSACHWPMESFFFGLEIGLKFGISSAWQHFSENACRNGSIAN